MRRFCGHLYRWCIAVRQRAALQEGQALIEYAPLSRRESAATEVLLEPFQAIKSITQKSSLDRRQRTRTDSELINEKREIPALAVLVKVLEQVQFRKMF